MMEEFGLITTVDFSLMDRVFYDGFWLETQTADGSNFWQPISTHHLTSPSFIFPASDNVGSWNTYPGPDNILKQTQTSDLFLNNSQMDHHLSHSSESNVPSGSLNNPDIEMNTRFWVGANRNTIDARAPISVRTRLDEAIFHLRDSVKDKNVLIQIWFPVKIDGKQVLITNNQPFSLDVNCKNLKEYRDVSKNYQFAADEESKEFVGLPSRVFLKKLPEWTPDVRFFKREEYPRVIYAQQYNVSGSLALPVFELGSRCCLGVVEIVTTTQKLNYRPELENICRALQAVDLKSFDVPSPPSIEGCEESYQSALADIRNIVKYMCSVHELPLAQTWAPCIQQNKQGCRHSDENYAHCVSTIDLACYVADPHVSGFHEACSEHHLLKGEGIPGKAFMSNKPCFSEDVTSFSKTDYPLSHHARVFKLCAAVAIRLRSTYTGKADFVLEFFLPPKCKDSNYQKMILDSLMSVLQQTCQSLRVPSHQELTQETSYKETVNTTAGRPCEEKWPNYIASRSEEASQNGPSWIMNITNSQHKGKGVSVSFDDNNEESGGEFRVTTRWDNPEEFSISGDCLSLDGKTNEKKRTKAEKTISLQVLRQYFAGSLKDAAKNIGVCPTTLKRICRQHGITRWPSRKIKKVDHSLKKLQLVMDSVQGAEGRIKLGSFYSNFPEFVSPNLPVNTSNMNIQTASKSPSSSSNHSTSSSYCLSTGVKQSSLTFTGDALSAEQLIDQGMLKRERSDVELLHQEAPPMPQKSSGQAKDDTSLYRIKANFGEEKIRFSLHPRWSFNDLKDEVFRRFNVENNVGKVDIKYLDDDAEWVLLTCDADLDECVDIHRSSKTRTIKIRVINKAYNQSLGSSFGSNK